MSNNSDDVPVLVTERLMLTIPGAQAAPARVAFNRANQRHLEPWNPAMSARDFDVEFWRVRLDGQVRQFKDGTRYAFSIFERAGGPAGPLVGYVDFSEVVRGVFLACYMGYALAETAQGRGYMTEAARAAVDYMFERVRLHRIMANYMPNNARSAAVLERLGFTVEGRAKAYLYLAGAWQDHVLTSLTNPEPIVPLL
ncbi:MAG TPA: GNAT family N-acetyltransferase [Candidatus Baltobacteraceae bacterium]|nr:GNAT family N-acetyltransferase [Candidatus Baltobacteraceae bacterium]